MEALKSQLAQLAEKVRKAPDHDSLMKAVDEMTEFLNKEKNRFGVAHEAEAQRATKSSK